MHLLLDDWGYNQSVDTLCLVTVIAECEVCSILRLLIACLESQTSAVGILRAECPVVSYIFCRESISALGQTQYLCNISLIGLNGAFACIRASPTKSTDSHTCDRHNPNSTDDVFALVYIFNVNALSIEYTYLIMKQVAAVGIGQEIALQLNTYIAAVAGVGTSTVIETCDGGGNLAVAHKPLVYWVHGVFKREWTLELSCLYLEVTIFLPLSKKVNNTRRIT